MPVDFNGTTCFLIHRHPLADIVMVPQGNLSFICSEYSPRWGKERWIDTVITAPGSLLHSIYGYNPDQHRIQKNLLTT